VHARTSDGDGVPYEAFDGHLADQQSDDPAHGEDQEVDPDGLEVSIEWLVVDAHQLLLWRRQTNPSQ
jgi:hypothetical protein